MIRKSLLPLGALLLCCASAHASWFDRWTPQGVVVAKIFHPSVLANAPGQEGIYKLELRDEQNKIHRQMVTAATFFAYEIGDRFDSSAPLPPRREVREAIAAEAKKASLEMRVVNSATATAMEPPKRVANARLTRDMLPETEAF
jgi:hypothetical protein